MEKDNDGLKAKVFDVMTESGGKVSVERMPPEGGDIEMLAFTQPTGFSIMPEVALTKDGDNNIQLWMRISLSEVVSKGGRVGAERCVDDQGRYGVKVKATNVWGVVEESVVIIPIY